MYGNEKPIKIHVWKDTKLNQPAPKIQLKAMTTNSKEYDPFTNARQLAKLFTSSLPGNTLDIFYGNIAHDLVRLVDPNISYSNEQYIENIVRIAINQLAEGEMINE